MAIGYESKRVGLATATALCAGMLVFPACAGKNAAVVKPSAPPAAGTEARGPGGPASRPAPPAAVPSAAPTSVPAAPAAGPEARAAAPRPPAPPPLIGHVARTDLEEYVTWKSLRAQDYTPDAEAVKRVGARAAGVEVIAMVGTWCGDSKREVPRFFKIADQAGFPMDKVTLVAVDRSKKDAEGLTEKHAITRVPTFVFFRAGQEIGRITERPKTTLENDLAEILAK